MPKPLTVWITPNWKILKEMGIPDHLTCLLGNPCAGQEATVRAGHGTTDWYQIGKGVRQGCIFLPCLFNLYGVMSFKSGCDISGKVVMTKIQWVQCLIQGCDVMREVDVTS